MSVSRIADGNMHSYSIRGVFKHGCLLLRIESNHAYTHRIFLLRGKNALLDTVAFSARKMVAFTNARIFIDPGSINDVISFYYPITQLGRQGKIT